MSPTDGSSGCHPRSTGKHACPTGAAARGITQNRTPGVAQEACQVEWVAQVDGVVIAMKWWPGIRLAHRERRPARQPFPHRQEQVATQKPHGFRKGVSEWMAGHLRIAEHDPVPRPSLPDVPSQCPHRQANTEKVWADDADDSPWSRDADHLPQHLLGVGNVFETLVRGNNVEQPVPKWESSGATLDEAEVLAWGWFERAGIEVDPGCVIPTGRQPMRGPAVPAPHVENSASRNECLDEFDVPMVVGFRSRGRESGRPNLLACPIEGVESWFGWGHDGVSSSCSKNSRYCRPISSQE